MNLTSPFVGRSPRRSPKGEAGRVGGECDRCRRSPTSMEFRFACIWRTTILHISMRITPAIEAYVSIATGEILEGRLPRNAARLVKEWTLARQSLLMDNWKNARSGKPIKKVPGLDADDGD